MNIEYIKKKIYKAPKRKVRLEDRFEDVEITKLLLIPTSKKWDGYKTGHFFALTKDGWFKGLYSAEFSNYGYPAQIRYMILKRRF